MKKTYPLILGLFAFLFSSTNCWSQQSYELFAEDGGFQRSYEKTLQELKDKKTFSNGETLKLLNGEEVKLVKFLGEGNTSTIFEVEMIENGQTVRRGIRLPKGLGNLKHGDRIVAPYLKYLRDTYDEYVKLSDSDLSLIKLHTEKSVRDRYLIVDLAKPKFSLFTYIMATDPNAAEVLKSSTYQDYLKQLGEYDSVMKDLAVIEKLSPQQKSFIDKKLQDFGSSLWEYDKIGDFHPFQVTFNADDLTNLNDDSKWILLDYAKGATKIGDSPQHLDLFASFRNFGLAKSKKNNVTENMRGFDLMEKAYNEERAVKLVEAMKQERPPEYLKRASLRLGAKRPQYFQDNSKFYIEVKEFNKLLDMLKSSHYQDAKSQTGKIIPHYTREHYIQGIKLGMKYSRPFYENGLDERFTRDLRAFNNAIAQLKEGKAKDSTLKWLEQFKDHPELFIETPDYLTHLEKRGFITKEQKTAVLYRKKKTGIKPFNDNGTYATDYYRVIEDMKKATIDNSLQVDLHDGKWVKVHQYLGENPTFYKFETDQGSLLMLPKKPSKQTQKIIEDYHIRIQDVRNRGARTANTDGINYGSNLFHLEEPVRVKLTLEEFLLIQRASHSKSESLDGQQYAKELELVRQKDKLMSEKGLTVEDVKEMEKDFKKFYESFWDFGKIDVSLENIVYDPKKGWILSGSALKAVPFGKDTFSQHPLRALFNDPKLKGIPFFKEVERSYHSKRFSNVQSMIHNGLENVKTQKFIIDEKLQQRHLDVARLYINQDPDGLGGYFKAAELDQLQDAMDIARGGDMKAKAQAAGKSCAAYSIGAFINMGAFQGLASPAAQESGGAIWEMNE